MGCKVKILSTQHTEEYFKEGVGQIFVVNSCIEDDPDDPDITYMVEGSSLRFSKHDLQVIHEELHACMQLKQEGSF